ncbi:MAG: YHYH protein [Bacteroidetes bacterium]|nr:MAG: YHYH protein [Bacteroidota bacterium]
MKNLLLLLTLCMFLAIACDDGETPDQSDVIEVDPALFLAEDLISSVTTEKCTLSDGTVTDCYRIETNAEPSDHTMGPWCPDNISDGAEAGGLWFENDELYDVDGAFIQNMATFYSDATWKMYNDDGTIKVTLTQEACQAAARPDVDPTYKNYCVECQPSYFSASSKKVYLIPVKPVKMSSSDAVDRMGVIGVAFNGINFDPPAPTDAILGAYTLAPMDDCGGHVNLATGYHYHAATGCSTEDTQSDGHAPMIGYAIDGFGLYAQLDASGNEPSDLDDCRGHSDDTRGYHYHVAAPGTNSFLPCFLGAQGSFSIE